MVREALKGSDPEDHAGRHVLRICRAEFCESSGCAATIERVERRLGVKLGETTADGSFALEQVFCLGMCGVSPAAMLDGKLYGRVSPQVADLLLDGILDGGARGETEIE